MLAPMSPNRRCFMQPLQEDCNRPPLEFWECSELFRWVFRERNLKLEEFLWVTLGFEEINEGRHLKFFVSIFLLLTKIYN